MECVAEDEIELEEIYLDEELVIDDKEDAVNKDEKEDSIMMCSLCKVNIPSSQAIHHLQNDHQIQRFSALESLLNLGIIMKSTNANCNGITNNKSEGTNYDVLDRSNSEGCHDMKTRIDIHTTSQLVNNNKRSIDLKRRSKRGTNIYKFLKSKEHQIDDILQSDVETLMDSKTIFQSKKCQDLNSKLVKKESYLPLRSDSINMSSEISPDRASNKDELSEKDQELCVQLRILPESFLDIKSTIIKECEKRSGLKLVEMRKLLKIDVNKTTKLYHHFFEQGLIYKPGSKVLESKVINSALESHIDLKQDLSESNRQVSAPSPKINRKIESTDVLVVSSSHKPAYLPGEIVLSHMKGYPWWPSMITTCPRSGISYEDNQYLVLFLDGKKNDTSWLSESEVRTFENFDDYLNKKKRGTRPALFARMRRANKCAQELKKWSNENRLNYFIKDNHSTDDLYQSILSTTKCLEAKSAVTSSDLITESKEASLASTKGKKKLHWRKRKALEDIKEASSNKKPDLVPSNKVPESKNTSSISIKRSKKLHWTKRTKYENGEVRGSSPKKVTKVAHPKEKSDLKTTSQIDIPHTYHQSQSDKDMISIEEDNDIVMIVNELLNELYS